MKSATFCMSCSIFNFTESMILTYIINTDVGMSRVIVEGCYLPEFLTEFVLPDVKADQISPDSVHFSCL